MTATRYRLAAPYVAVRANWADDWKIEPWLECLKAEASLAPTVPAAVLRWVYGRIDDGDGAPVEYPPFETGLAGQYVRLCRPPTAEEALANPPVVFVPFWHGVILGDGDDLGAVDLGPATGDQTLACRGLEALLERAVVTGSYVQGPYTEGEGFAAPVQIHTRLSFNLPHRNGLSIRGNRSAAKYQGPGGLSSYVFGEGTGGGAVWTARDIAEYLLAWFAPAALGWRMATAGCVLNLDHLKDVWDAPRNVREGLNRLIDRRRGHSWRIVVGADGVPTVAVYSVFDEDITSGDITYTAGTERVSIPHDWTNGVSIRRDLEHEFDKILVRGRPLILCGTLSYADGTLVKGWGDAAEAAYKAATATPVGNNDPAEANDRARAAEKWDHVYRDFIAPADALPGGPTSDADGALGLEEEDPEAMVFGLGKTFLRQLPILKTTDDPDGPPEFRAPFAVATVTVGNQTCDAVLDRLGDWFASAPSMSLHALAGRPGVRVGATPNYYLARNHWTGATACQHTPHIDYETLRATVAWNSDACQQVAVDLGGGDAPRTLVIDVPGAECWVLLGGTITDVTATGPVTTGGPSLLRDDGADLRAVAVLAEAWYGRTRRAASVRWKFFVYDFVPGAILDQVLFKAGAADCGTPVTKIAWDFVAGETVLETDFCELDFHATAGLRRGRPGLAGGGGGQPAHEPNSAVRLPAPGTGLGILYGRCYTDGLPRAGTHPEYVQVHVCDAAGGNVQDGSGTPAVPNVVYKLYHDWTGAGSPGPRPIPHYLAGMVVAFLPLSADTGVVMGNFQLPPGLPLTAFKNLAPELVDGDGAPTADGTGTPSGRLAWDWSRTHS